MCLKETIASVACGHTIKMFTPCRDAEYFTGPEGLEATPCDALVKHGVTTDKICDRSCPYRLYNKRWICCECDGPNQRRFRCAIKGCGHLICDVCKPLTRWRIRQSGRSRSTSPGGRVDRSRSVSPDERESQSRGEPVPDLATRPRIPVYDPSVGGWV
ncbi:hypothetical protein CMUS01_08760 [Colletotrichum musicola]|uniref:Uncharacterized protein n=1 Tax=Colletotrichum musicola TaxID=2175873 RepID=A0A8H6KAQ8_9PEZI|nr:hypothetical protein CMUS01_08760 [Colletotrichum musicola]